MERFAKIINGYNYFHSTISAFHVLYFMKKMTFFHNVLIFIPKVFIQCKKVCGPTELDKYTSTRPIFRMRNFICYPDQAREIKLIAHIWLRKN